MCERKEYIKMCAKAEETLDIHHRFDDWLNNHCSELVRFDTFEQLWLAFVMKEKYNKVWNGEDWVKA